MPVVILWLGVPRSAGGRRLLHHSRDALKANATLIENGAPGRPVFVCQILIDIIDYAAVARINKTGRLARAVIVAIGGGPALGWYFPQFDFCRNCTAHDNFLADRGTRHSHEPHIL